MKSKVQHCVTTTKKALESAEFLTIQDIQRLAKVSRPTASRAISSMRNRGVIYGHKAAITRYFQSHDKFVEWESNQVSNKWRSMTESGDEDGIKFGCNSSGNGIINSARKSPIYRFDQLLRGVRA